MTSPAIDRPLPAPTAESRRYWAGLEAHRLVLQRCADCRTPRHYPRPMCAACFSLEHEWFEASGEGRVHSWTMSHHAFHRGFASETPYVLVTIDLAEGVRLVAPLVGNDASRLALGLRMVLEYEDVSDELTLPRLRIDA